MSTVVQLVFIFSAFVLLCQSATLQVSRAAVFVFLVVIVALIAYKRVCSRSGNSLLSEREGFETRTPTHVCRVRVRWNLFVMFYKRFHLEGLRVLARSSVQPLKPKNEGLNSSQIS